MKPLRPQVDQIESIDDVVIPEPNTTGDGDLPINGNAAMLAIKLSMGLKRLREARGLMMKDVAARSGLDMGTLSRLENGKIFNPRLDTLWRYAVAVGYEIETTFVPLGPDREVEAEGMLSA